MILLLFGMAFEMISIGAMLPVLTAILKPSLILDNIHLSEMMGSIGLVNEREITIYLMAALIFIYILKSIFLLWSNKQQNQVNANLTETITNNIYRKYLDQDYLFHVNKNSSEIIKIFQVDINHFNTFIISSLSLITEISIVIAIIITLLLVEPIGVISTIIIFIIFSYGFLLISRAQSKKWGTEREQNDKQISKLLLETFRGIKEIIKTNSFLFFSKTNESYSGIRAKLSAKSKTLSQVPRYFLEIITILTLVFFIFIKMFQGSSVESVIVSLGIFVAAILRILPSVNRILTALQQINYYQSSVDALYREILGTEKSKIAFKSGYVQNEIIFQNKIGLKNIYFSYEGDNQLEILKDINLEIKKGSFVGIIGDSGSGKSTLINILAGLISPNQGKIIVDDHTVSLNDRRNWRDKIGYVSQSTYLLDASIAKNVAFGIALDQISQDTLKKSLEEAQILDFVNTLPNGIDALLGERGVQFSGGQQQRIGIARALYRRPEILILDEATSALDVKTEEEIMKSICALKHKITIVMITHRTTTLDACTDVYSLNNGILEKIK